MSYRTVAGRGQAEIVIKKSRFIAHVAPVASEEAAWAFVNEIRAAHSDATHNCFAFTAGAVQRMSDDGEPSGTAGRPIFEVLEKQGLSDTAIVVTRYFGGILLGAGGLVRAYSQAAAAGVEAAGVAEALPAVDLRVRVDYALLGRVQYLLQQHGALTLQTDFGQEVVIVFRVLETDRDRVTAELAEASAGRIAVEPVGTALVGPDLQPIHRQ
ncbi:YigZ family protein [Symbiobacterium thermophilum]|uniref:YigZ family protein n=1 Tax=Symbiobacterium thermophilum TaxID=2734 RepID=UPI0023570630|nr:YigZ family protein [Symbiobacterium thermophilum]